LPSRWRNLVVLILAITVPVSLVADDISSALLIGDGHGVLVNGSAAPQSLTVFAGDTIQIEKDALARLQLTGSAANIGSQTTVVFDGDQLSLDHGALSVYTSKGFRVRVNCLTITPVNPSLETLYEVVESEGRVTVHATKSDVYIDRHSNSLQETRRPTKSDRDILGEGEQKSREEHCPGAAMKGATPAAGKKALLNTTWMRATAGGVIGIFTICTLLKPDDPVSPGSPSPKSPCGPIP